MDEEIVAIGLRIVGLFNPACGVQEISEHEFRVPDICAFKFSVVGDIQKAVSLPAKMEHD